MLPASVPYRVREKAVESVRRAYKPCSDYRNNRCTNPTRCRYSREGEGRLDEACLLRSLANLKIQPELFPVVIANALASRDDRDPVVAARRQQLTKVSRGEIL